MEQAEILAKLQDLRETIWGEDILSPTVPEYVEHHNSIKKILKEHDALIDAIMIEPDSCKEPAQEVPIGMYELFADRTTSLLKRWQGFKQDHACMPDIDKVCIRGFLDEVNDGYTKQMLEEN